MVWGLPGVRVVVGQAWSGCVVLMVYGGEWFE